MNDRAFGTIFAAWAVFVIAAWCGIGYVIYKILTHWNIV